MKTTIAIIGPSGRYDTEFLTANVYQKMIAKTKKIITEKLKMNPNDVELISGGAAWSDHVAVKLFVDKFVTDVTLCITAKWDSTNKKYIESSGKYDCGRISNFYHAKFTDVVGYSTLEELDTAITEGINIKYFPGFKNRNNEIANAKYLIAFSFDDTAPSQGGTLHTWTASKSKTKININIKKL